MHLDSQGLEEDHKWIDGQPLAPTSPWPISGCKWMVSRQLFKCVHLVLYIQGLLIVLNSWNQCSRRSSVLKVHPDDLDERPLTLWKRSVNSHDRTKEEVSDGEMWFMVSYMYKSITCYQQHDTKSANTPRLTSMAWHKVEIISPQWLHLDGHLYDIETSQPSSHQMERQHHHWADTTRWKYNVRDSHQTSRMFVNVVEFCLPNS